VLGVVKVHRALALVPRDEIAEQHRYVRPLHHRPLAVEQCGEKRLAEPLRLDTITRVQARLISAHPREVDLPIEHPVLRLLKQPDAGTSVAEASRQRSVLRLAPLIAPRVAPHARFPPRRPSRARASAFGS
jgi:hypothetical protein